MKIAFIQSNDIKESVVRRGSNFLALLGLAAIFKERGCQVLYVDAYLEDLTTQQVVERLTKFQPQVVGISCVTDNRFVCINTIRSIRKAFPDVLMMAGGHQFSYHSEDALKHIPELDLIVRGEGEEVAIRLLETDFNPHHFEKIPRLTYRGADNAIISTADDDKLDSLDDFPMPDWTLLPRDHITEFGISTARGCVGQCIFCSGATRRTRFRSPERVLDEMGFILDLFGREKIDGHFVWADDTLTQRKEHFFALMEGMINRGFDFRWFMRSRADAISEELVRLAKEAGCVQIGTSIDAPSQRIMDYMGKGERINEIINAFEVCSRFGIKSVGSIILGYEGETIEDIRNAARIQNRLNRLPHVVISTTLLRVYPGTRLEKIALEKGSLPTDFSWYRPLDMKKVETDVSANIQLVPFFKPSTMPYERLKWLHFRYFRLNPDFIKQTIKYYLITKRQFKLLLNPVVYRVVFSRLFNFISRGKR